MGFELGHIENHIKGRLHELLRFGSDRWVLLEDNFLALIGFSVEHNLAPLVNNFREVQTVEGLRRVQDGLLEVKFVQAGQSQD